MVPPRTPSFAARDAPLVRSGESAVSPPRAEGRPPAWRACFTSVSGTVPRQDARPAVEDRSGPRVALATCAEIPAGDEDFPALIAALAALGVEAEAAVWDAEVDWASFDLVVLRSTWDYAERRDAFLGWARSLPRVLNGVPVLEWNTDKQRYLADLAAAGVPVVPTAFAEPGRPLELPDGPFVVKPAVSAGGRSSARFEPHQAEAARVLAARIHAEGRTAMVQPHLDEAEIALVYLDGACSHAVGRRVPLPAAGHREVFYLDEAIAPAAPTAEQRSVADAAVAASPSGLLYARVDLLGGAVLELELAEPSLYLDYGDGASARFAAAISQRLRISPEKGRIASQ
jgi:glutathione synthase/RimK-type ligase-like ATP-grasp enzyme